MARKSFHETSRVAGTVLCLGSALAGVRIAETDGHGAFRDDLPANICLL